jgi:hypothetical protein
MVNLMKAIVFYADILGFSKLARRPRARGALEQLSDVAHLLSTEDSVAKYVQRPVWRRRYGLSDSIFLVGDDAIQAPAAAAEFFFNLAFYNATQDVPTLMRGAITFGEVHQTRGIFPETAKENVVGEAVVRAVQLERSGAKGPRLLISPEVAQALKQSRLSPLLDSTREGVLELLWLLPPDVSLTDGLLVGDVVAAAVRLALSPSRREAAPHHIAYLDLAMRSLIRLKRYDPEAAEVAIRKAAIKKLRDRLDRALNRPEDDAQSTRQALARLLR